MSIQAVNQTVSTAIEVIQTSSTDSLSFAEKALDLASNLFDVSKETILDHPWVALTTVAAIGIGICFLTYSRKTPPPSTQELVLQTEQLLPQSNSAPRVSNTLEGFVTRLFQSTDFRGQIGPVGSNMHLQEFLKDKIMKVIQGEASPASKVEMIRNVIANFSDTISTAQVRVNADIATERLIDLGVNAQDTIAEIRPLGDETHHGGKIPLRIVLPSGHSIVYKPRSMMPEKLICDSNEGILRHEGFGTYNVVCRTDASGDYGYSDFVKNIQEENTVSRREEVEQYVRKLCLLEEVASRLSLSDLHYMNIITDHRNPCIVDAEVFLNPPGTESGIMNEGNGALHVFDIMKGTDRKFVGKNKIWFHPDLTMKNQCDFRFGMSKENLAKIGVNVAEIQATTRLSEETELEIEQIRRNLAASNGRFILEETTTLTRMQPALDHQNEHGISIFIDSVRDWVRGQEGFRFNENAVGLIREGIIEDIRNHDIPAFHYNSQREEILYYDAVIGVRNASSSSSSSSKEY